MHVILLSPLNLAQRLRVDIPILPLRGHIIFSFKNAVVSDITCFQGSEHIDLFCLTFISKLSSINVKMKIVHVCGHYIKTKKKTLAITSALHIQWPFLFGIARKPPYESSQLLKVVGLFWRQPAGINMLRPIGLGILKISDVWHTSMEKTEKPRDPWIR